MADNTEVTTVTPELTTTSKVVKLTKSGLLADKNSGLTNPEMAKKYNLAVTQITKALKMAGIVNIKAKAKAKFEIVED